MGAADYEEEEDEEGDETSGADLGDNEDLMLAVADEHQAMPGDW